jgi:alpha/beta superfamily hydrolase
VTKLPTQTLPLAPAREPGLRTIEDLSGPAGYLEALLNEARPDVHAGSTTPPCAVVLCHPHPLFGGTLHNKVVYRAMKTFSGLGMPVLRFNFRGTGRSAGVHDYGEGEQEDVRAALAWLRRQYPKPMPIVAAGFSFGAHMVLRAGCAAPDVVGIVSLGTPIEAGDRRYTYEFLADCSKPKLFVSGSADAFGPVAPIEAAVNAAAGENELAWIAGADHFFVGKLDLMQHALHAWLLKHIVLPQSHSAEREEA